MPLTPIQDWFFEQQFANPHHFNQAMLLEVGRPLELDPLERAVQELLLQHDALRLRFSCDGDQWRQTIVEPAEDVSVTRVDLSAMPETEQVATLEAQAAEFQRSLNLFEGPLLRVAYFDLGEGRPHRLLIVIHHLAVDVVSWRILLEDLATAYEQAERKEAIALPPKTTSLKHWSERLSEYARSAAMEAELEPWLKAAGAQVSPLPVDFPEGHNDVASAEAVSVVLEADETQVLFQEAPRAYHTQVNELLLTAITLALSKFSGEPHLLVDLEGHGRESPVEGLDVSRTVGWFTAVYPVWLRLERQMGPGEAIKTIKEQIRAVPRQAVTFGLLRHLSEKPEMVEPIRRLPVPEVIFLFTGRTESDVADSSLFCLAKESSGPTQDDSQRRHHLLEITAGVLHGRLTTSWTFSRNLHRRATIVGLAEDFADTLRTLIGHCRCPEAGGFTPSDFPEADLGQEDLDRLIERIDGTGQ